MVRPSVLRIVIDDFAKKEEWIENANKNIEYNLVPFNHTLLRILVNNRNILARSFV